MPFLPLPLTVLRIIVTFIPPPDRTALNSICKSLYCVMASMARPDLTKILPCEQTIGYNFQDKDLLWEALQADGSPNCPTDNPRYEVGNKRLAIVGNLALDLLLASVWYPTWNTRAVLDSSRGETLSETSLDQVAQRNELYHHIIRRPGTFFGVETLSAAVEAIVGAAYLDGGTTAVQRVVQKLGIEM
ncbi:MAG: hypothetical protein L6R42_005660 [Xanthoria sp. 1 TBL-2021]|nr:MAG: hypothetical protein L6R42_005660 [Xanthoria sp. 1 TBL-2021]